MMTPFHTKVASTSPTADLITRIRNGNMRRKDFVICRTSGLGKGILEALWSEGFIFGYQVLENEQESKVYLKYSEGRPCHPADSSGIQARKAALCGREATEDESKEEFIHGFDLDHLEKVSCRTVKPSP